MNLPEHIMEQLQSAEYSKNAIQKVTPTHDGIIDWMIANPMAHTSKEIATAFGYSEVWINRLRGSDAFQARLAARKEELVDPFIRNSIEENFKGLAQQSMDVLMEKLAEDRNPEVALRALDLTSKALGYGARDQGPKVQMNFVVAMPEKAENAASWAEAHGGNVIDSKDLGGN